MPLHRITIDEALNGPQGLRHFDAVIDARSPSEWQLDHLPSAVNWPSLTTLATKSPRTRVSTSRSSWKEEGITWIVRKATTTLTAKASVAKGRSSWRGGMPAADITMSSESPLSLLSA